MNSLPDIVTPALALGVLEVQLENDQVMDVMTIEFTTASTSYTCRIADKGNYRQVADKLAEGIRRLGAEMREPHVKLITNVKGLPDGIRKA